MSAAVLWTADELRAATGGALARDVSVSGVSIDSRTAQPGDLFVALRDARDGHAFVADALARGAACARLADRAWVTDDNPRGEDPGAIRAAVLAGCPGGVDAGGDRAGAIARAVSDLRPGDVLAVAGKGHESGQTIGAVAHPFDDAAVVRAASAGHAA